MHFNRIQDDLIPGTVLRRDAMGGSSGAEFLDKIFYISDGIMLSQIREISGIDGSTLQNWTKRGWVGNAKNKRYNKNQLARILIINMLRDSMQLERIAFILRYINGRVDDESDNIINEAQLYDYICRITESIISDQSLDRDTVSERIERMTADYEPRAAGAANQLRRALEVIIVAYYASLLRHHAGDLIVALGAERSSDGRKR